MCAMLQSKLDLKITAASQIYGFLANKKPF